MNKTAFQLSILVSSICILACFDFGPTYSKLPPGPWRGVLKLDPEQQRLQAAPKETKVSDNILFDEFTDGDLPFNFEVKYITPDSFVIELANADEKITLSEIRYGKDHATNKDTVTIHFDPYDSYLKMIFEDNVMEGTWNVPSRGAMYQVHVVARHGQNHRFTTLKKEPSANLTGKWETHFEIETDNPFPAIGEFVQHGNHIIGTFITETGDYRYLEGTVQDNKLYLSAFDGAHMFLFEALIKDENTLSGVFRNGTHYLTGWEAKRNEQFLLTAADSLSKQTGGAVEFTFESPEGKMISLSDPEYIGKPKVIQLFGTWCPNCVDETKFIVDFIKEENPDVAFFGLAYERHQDRSKAMAAIARFRDKLQVPYPMVLAGNYVNGDRGSLPFIDEIISYPTLIFLDDTDKIVRIHTGFSGPATSEYSEFIASFNNTIAEITVSTD